jgi:hypothetical protein
VSRDSLDPRPAAPAAPVAPPWLNARFVLGVFVLAVGVTFLLDQFGLAEPGRVLRYGIPALLLVLGIVRLVQPGSGRFASAVLILLGGGLLLDALDWLELDWDLIFPLGLVLVGGWLVVRAVSRPRAAGGSDADGDRISAFALLGGTKRRSTSPVFRGGDASAILGACEIDLTQAGLPEEGAVLDLFALWGGVDVRVPTGWRVELRGLPILGGFEDQTTGAGTDGRRLIVTGMVIMGGVEVKN